MRCVGSASNRIIQVLCAPTCGRTRCADVTLPPTSLARRFVSLTQESIFNVGRAISPETRSLLCQLNPFPEFGVLFVAAKFIVVLGYEPVLRPEPADEELEQQRVAGEMEFRVAVAV